MKVLSPIIFSVYIKFSPSLSVFGGCSGLLAPDDTDALCPSDFNQYLTRIKL